MKIYRFMVFIVLVIIPHANGLGSEHLRSPNTNGRPVSFSPQRAMFECFGVENGLSSNDVLSIAEDSLGFMWFGTNNGLNRYDGYAFRSFSFGENSERIDSSPYFFAYVDSEGTLWVAGGSALYKFDSQKVAFDKILEARWEQQIYSMGGILRDSEGTLWLGTWGNGVITLTRDANATPEQTSAQYSVMPGYAIRQYTSEDSLPNNFVLPMIEDENGDIWIGTKNGLVRVRKQTGQFEHFFHDAEVSTSLSSNVISSLYQDSSGHIWIGTFGGGLNRFCEEKQQFRRFQHRERDPESISDDYVMSIAEDRSGSLWVGTGNGLNRFDRTTESFRRYSSQSHEGSLSANIIHSVYVDSQGILWVGTRRGGVCRFDRVSSRFYHYEAALAQEPEVSTGASVHGGLVLSIEQSDDGLVWIGTDKGINALDSKEAVRIFTYHNPFNSNPSATVTTHIVEDSHHGVIWVGTSGGLLNMQYSTTDPLRPDFLYYLPDSNDPSSMSNRIRSIRLTRDGNLWVATHDGLFYFQTKTEEFTRYVHLSNDSTSLSHNNVTDVLLDHDQTLWIATLGGGLNKLTQGKASSANAVRFKHYRFHPEDDSSIRSNNLLSLFEDTAGRLWIGTRGGGLSRFIRASDSFISYSIEDDLPSKSVRSIIEDQNGSLWLGTPRGLARFNPENNTVKAYGTEDGLPFLDFGEQACCRLKSGELMFGGSGGVLRFHPDDITVNLHEPPVVFTGFRVLSQPREIAPDGSTPIRLSHNEDHFSFEFSALDYAASEKNQYAYRLEGFDQNWRHVGTRRTATYTNLDGGKYVFRVKASNNDGVWNEKGTAVEIVIQTPFWDTWWFRGGAATVAAGLIALFYQYRIRRIREMENLRARIAADLHDDLGSSLSSLRVYSEFALKKLKEDPEIVAGVLKRIFSTSHDAMEGIKHLVWSISPESDRLVDFIALFQTHASELCTAEGMDFVPQVSHLPPDKELPPETCRDIYLILKEGLRNILKHSDSSKVEFRVWFEDGKLTLELVDDGKGFEMGTDTKGHGLRNMQRRAGTAGFALSIKSKPDWGTKMKITTQIT